MAIYENITELIGNTPIVKLNRLVPEGAADVYVKLEAFNPGSSVKDRIALSMIEKAEADGLIKPGDTIVEATSGNTGIGLSWVGAAKGYKVVIVMPETMSVERRKIIQAYGAELAPMEVGHFGLNIPVREIATGKIEMTSQNHLYSIARDSLPHDLLVTHENVNDHSIEAFRHRYQPILGVQFQVDASPGTRENLYFYDEFLELIDAKIHESRREKE